MYIRREFPNSKIILLLIIVTSLIGDVIYLKVASLYQFLFLFFAFLVCYSDGLMLSFSANNYAVDFFMWMSLEAAVSIIWAPDKGLAGKYTYYVAMIFLFAFLLEKLVTKENIDFFNTILVLVLFVINLIGVWESLTNEHIHPGYLNTPHRARVFAYVPSAFFMNPNDFATYIMQILPFSLITSVSKKGKLTYIAIANIFLSLYIILKTEARTQLVLVMLLLVYFLFLSVKKGRAAKLLFLIAVGSILVLTLFPTVIDFFQKGLLSISTKEIKNSSEDGGSLKTRISLLQNGVIMLVKTFGIGVGAGCHRVLMGQYSHKYYYTKSVTVMHNLVGEIFVDYGFIIGVLFLRSVQKMCRQLGWIAQNDAKNEVEARILLITLYMIFVCGISSSSIIQQTSIWVTFCYIGVFARINTEGLNAKKKMAVVRKQEICSDNASKKTLHLLDSRNVERSTENVAAIQQPVVVDSKMK